MPLLDPVDAAFGRVALSVEIRITADRTAAAGALQLTGEKLQADAGNAQLLARRRRLDAAAQPLVLVHHERDRDARRPGAPGPG
ncbi:hypothetical protein [Streptosporangium roseum]|uniref:hypothetical protein n=1 Tax=Streptosporangium roseum TaxID=2001 RepID=UPI00146A0D01|nr:hypothetical protein [Streptosporangium roseum]